MERKQQPVPEVTRWQLFLGGVIFGMIVFLCLAVLALATFAKG